MPEPGRNIGPQALAESSRAILLTEVVAMGGAERACLALARWLNGRGLPAHVLTYRDEVGLRRFTQHDLTVVQLQPRMDARHKVAALGAYLRAHPHAPKLLVSGYQPALHTTLAGGRGFHCLMHDTPSLFSEPEGTGSLRQRVARSARNHIVGFGLRSGGQTIVTSEYLQQECRRDFGVTATIVRMGGLEALTAFRPRAVEGTLRMLSICRLEGNKRLDWILRALGAMERTSPPLSAQLDWCLEIAGTGSQMDLLRSLAVELAIADRIHLLGFVPDDELERLYGQAHLFLMPAVQGYGIPAIESLQRGIPVLLHRESGVSDILLRTPWATVLEGGEPAMLPALRNAIASVRAGAHLAVALPPIPTEDSWAEQVAGLCGWI